MDRKLKIIEYFWSVGHRTKRVGSQKMSLREGEARRLCYLLFRIERVEAHKVIVSVSHEDGRRIKTLTVEKGKKNWYRPMSMDAGHEYVLKFTKWF